MPHADPEVAKVYFRERHQRLRAQILARLKAYREANPEKVAAAKARCYERIKDNPEFKKARSAYQKARRAANRENVKAIEKRSYDKHADKRAEYNRKIANTVERKAREALVREVRAGRMPRAFTLQCAVCRRQADEYHHPSYAREDWFKVVPVCHQCHKDIHHNLRG
jgi:hypothetical protein